MFFAITDVWGVQTYLTRMFGIGDAVNVNPMDYLICIRRHGIALLLGATCCTGIVEKVFEKWKHTLALSLVLAALFWFCAWRVLAAGTNPFLYLSY